MRRQVSIGSAQSAGPLQLPTLAVTTRSALRGCRRFGLGMGHFEPKLLGRIGHSANDSAINSFHFTGLAATSVAIRLAAD
jgi:hypothetical protein